MSLVDPGLSLVVVATLLMLFAGAAARVAMLGVEVEVLTAAARAGLQLTAVALVLAAVLDSDGLALLFVVGMLLAAGVAGGQRIAGWRCAPWAGLAVAAGAVPVLALVLGSGVGWTVARPAWRSPVRPPLRRCSPRWIRRAPWVW